MTYIGLTQRVVKSTVWVFGLRVTERSFYFIRLIILARILSPEDFGLLGIAMLTMLTIENFTQTGFHAALIQKQQGSEQYLNVAWTVGIIRGIVLFLILLIIAPYAALFFGVPHAKIMIQVIGCSVLLQSFTNIGVIYFQKNLEFHKQFLYQLSGTLTDFIVAISATFVLKSAWALVFGLLAGNLARLVMSYVVHSYRPRISIDYEKAKNLFEFGKWILGSNVIVYFLTQGDSVFVGKIMGVTMLGFYQMAYKISNAPSSEITNVISQVTFPAYATIQFDGNKLREAFLKVFNTTLVLSFPIASLIFVLSSDFTKVFMGEKWIPIIPIIQMLCILGLIGSINGTISPLLRAMGKPWIVTIASGAQLIILFILIYPLSVRWGILGVCMAVIIPSVLVMIYLSLMVCNILKCKVTSLFKPFIIPVAGCSIIFLVAMLLRIINGFEIIRFFLILITGAVTYSGFIYWIDKDKTYNIRSAFEIIFQKVI
jgi:lipopolysaccharide exporter